MKKGILGRAFPSEGLTPGAAVSPPPAVAPKREHFNSAVGGIGAAITAANEATWIYLDPDLIDVSPFTDRMGIDDELDGLVASIDSDGQRLPVLVRRTGARYQLAYGHRRHAAIQKINARKEPEEKRLFIKAFVAELDDARLLAAQISENAARLDLTWIEKALFLEKIDQVIAQSGAGYWERKQADGKKVLGLTDSQASKMRKVISTIPKEVLHGIGRAEGIGEPRWMAFAQAYEKLTDSQRPQLAGFAEGLKVAKSERFKAVFDHIRTVTRQPRADQAGFALKVTPNGISLSLPPGQAEEFAEVLRETYARWIADKA